MKSGPSRVKIFTPPNIQVGGPGVYYGDMGLARQLWMDFVFPKTITDRRNLVQKFPRCAVADKREVEAVLAAPDGTSWRGRRGS